jgi:hypothetical protein
MTSSGAVGDSCRVHSSSPLLASNQVQGAGYFEFEVETDAVPLQLETSVTDLKLEMDARHHRLCMEEKTQESPMESLQPKRGGGRKRG